MFNKKYVKIAVAILVIVILFRVLTRPVSEKFEPNDVEFLQQATVPPSETTKPVQTTGPTSSPAITTTPVPRDVSTMAPMTTSVDLLPKPNSASDSEFGQFAPTKAIEAQNFVDATKLVGVDSVGSSLRNASYDLRRSPTIPRTNIGPWQQSTIDSDLYRKSLDC